MSVADSSEVRRAILGVLLGIALGALIGLMGRRGGAGRGA